MLYKRSLIRGFGFLLKNLSDGSGKQNCSCQTLRVPMHFTLIQKADKNVWISRDQTFMRWVQEIVHSLLVNTHADLTEL